MLFLSPGRSCFSTSNHMLIRSVSMFYSVLAAADDRRRPWADPATQTHQTLSLLLHSLTRHTKSLWWRSNKWCTGAIERNPREVPKWRQFSFDQDFCQFQKKILSTNVKQFWMGEEMMCMLLQWCLVFEWSFRATLDTTSLCKRLAHTDAADTGL